jgi:hypothetical protein
MSTCCATSTQVRPEHLRQLDLAHHLVSSAELTLRTKSQRWVCPEIALTYIDSRSNAQLLTASEGQGGGARARRASLPLPGLSRRAAKE